MTTSLDLQSEVAQIFREDWVVEKTDRVPDPTQLRLANHAKEFESATVLYADIDGSTSMVDNHDWRFSSEVYKAYLRCAARIIADEGGDITAYDGDRIMAVFTGERKNSCAVMAAMKINYAVQSIIRPSLSSHYPNQRFLLNHIIGIDTSPLRASRIGVRGYNDLVWVGRAANYAAKLTNLSGQPLWITNDVFRVMNEELKVSKNGVSLWKAHYWNAMNRMEIFNSNAEYHF